MGRAAAYNRDHALEAAMELFWRKGYHATSLKDLEAVLAMKPGSIYAAFDSKENLYLLALARYFDAARARFRDQIGSAPSVLAGLADHLRNYAVLCPDSPHSQACMLTKSLMDTRRTDPDISAQTQKYLMDMRHAFETAFAHARTNHEIHPDANCAQLARRYQANLNAIRFELHMGMPPDDIAELAEEIAQEIETLRLAS